ncbi:hypothetical protein QJQ45_026843 [Haematococcus lacustris]|nr:hypothetical protein QJQ45_026843 [Haematococcus lacustris]
MAAWSVARPVILSRVACRVVIVGWTGSSARYLSKYARLWACSGAHEVLILRTSVSMVLYRWRGMAAAAEDVKRIERLHQDTPGLPTVFHIFSTGGYMKAAAIWQQMERLLPPDTRHSLLADIQGIIFDSAPAIVTEDVAVLALQSVFSGMSAEALKRGDKAGPVQAALQTATRLAMRWYLARPHIILREQEVRAGLLWPGLAWPGMPWPGLGATVSGQWG